MIAWRSGSTVAIPFGLHGIGVRESAEPQTDSPTAYVIAEPGKKGRRFLLPGLGLVSPGRMLSRDSARSGARTETGVAALALASETRVLVVEATRYLRNERSHCAVRQLAWALQVQKGMTAASAAAAAHKLVHD